MQNEPLRKYSVHDTIQMPFTHVPSNRTVIAVQNGVEKNVLIKTWGGIGDQICAEPTLRYALKAFKDCNVSLASECPELFSHLKFKDIFDLRRVRPIYEKYIAFETITPPDSSNLVWQFFSHLLTNCVDFASMCALRMQLPIAERNVILPDCNFESPLNFHSEKAVMVHAGRHWATKTFPKDWWDAVLKEIISLGKVPVLIGANTDDNRGTVDVETEGCVDLRNKLSIMETISLLKQSKVLLTNDSAPLHMAVDSLCWIGYIATCKHPDMITHYRKNKINSVVDLDRLRNGFNGNGFMENVWGWRMVNHGKGGIWDIVDMTPNTDKTVEVEFVEEDILRSWLPDPKDYAQWAAEKVSQ